MNRYAPHVALRPSDLACPKADACRWNQDAIAAGVKQCLPGRLGMLCEHVGGEWNNTFDMAEPSEWAALETEARC